MANLNLTLRYLRSEQWSTTDQGSMAPGSRIGLVKCIVTTIPLELNVPVKLTEISKDLAVMLGP